jgi:hypothetical protein
VNMDHLSVCRDIPVHGHTGDAGAVPVLDSESVVGEFTAHSPASSSYSNETTAVVP